MLAAVDVGAEPDAVVGNLSQRPHAEGLEPAAVGEYGSVPAHESVQTAQLGHGFHAGSQVQVVGVAQDHLGADTPDFLRRQAFDRGLGSHRHEERRERFPVGRRKHPGSRCAVGVL